MKPKFNVTLFTEVAVKYSGIEADTPEKAVEQAENSLDLHQVIDCNYVRTFGKAAVEYVTWTEGPYLAASVDPIGANGDVDYSNTVALDSEGQRMSCDHLAPAAHKAQGYERAEKFMNELLNLVETFTEIAEQHGVRTLSDLLYLQNAILTGSHIDLWPDESKVWEIVQVMPSAELWQRHIKFDGRPFQVDLTMEGGQTRSWVGLADDADHAEGLAIAESTAITGEQVQAVSHTPTVLQPFDQNDFDRNPGKYALFKTARIAKQLQPSSPFKVGEIVRLKHLANLNNLGTHMPLYAVWAQGQELLNENSHQLFGVALGDFCL